MWTATVSFLGSLKFYVIDIDASVAFTWFILVDLIFKQIH